MDFPNASLKKLQLIYRHARIVTRVLNSLKFFKFHSCRKRLFLVIVEGLVQKIHSLLGRWKCPICKNSFTYYPDFAIPYKRYVKDNIVKLAHQYVEDDETTYQEVVKENGLAIGYDSGTDKIDERQFEGSTLWRWFGLIGSLNHVLSNGLNLIRQKSPSSEIFREILPIHPNGTDLRKN